MAEIIRMPKMSDTMSEGTIAAWHIKVGDAVKSGDIIADVETDKATMELESYESGTLLYIGIGQGESIPVDGIIAILGKPDEDYKSLLAGGEPVVDVPIITEAPKAVEPVVPVVTAAHVQNVNATVITMPKMSDTMTEGTIVSWLKKVGDKVKSGEMLAEVETDKATMELESYEDGTLLYIGVQVGEAIAVDGIIAIIGEAGADYGVLLNPQVGSQQSAAGGVPLGSQQPIADSPQPIVDSPQPESESPTSKVQSPESGLDSRLKASPLAKALAKEKGIDLSKISGTGENGRIVKRDVDASPQSIVDSPQSAVVGSQQSAVSSQQPIVQVVQSPKAITDAPITNHQSPITNDYEDTPVSNMRKTIARRLSESMFTAPHFYLTMEINMDKATELRATLNAVAPAKISFNDFVIKASSLALKQHPTINSSWLGDKIRKNNQINIGVAVAVDEGLLVPVVRNADQKTLSTINAEVKDYAAKAKDKKLQPKDWEGNTFSISNLGMFGIDEFTAIINPPDACILAVGGIKQTAGFREDGSVYPTSVMKVTLSCDHRVVDGASGAAFLQTLKKFLENPMLMLI